MPDWPFGAHSLGDVSLLQSFGRHYAHVFDEMELAVIATRVGVSLLAVRIRGTRYWPDVDAYRFLQRPGCTEGSGRAWQAHLEARAVAATTALGPELAAVCDSISS